MSTKRQNMIVLQHSCGVLRETTWNMESLLHKWNLITTLNDNYQLFIET